MKRNIRIRDKERTKQKLVDAVGKILRKDGFSGLGVNKVAEVAKVNKRLIYEYFKSLDNLTRIYLKTVDFWDLQNNAQERYAEAEILTKEKVLNLLKGNYDFFSNSIEMQKVVLWGISEKNKTIRALTDEREEFGKKLFELSDKTFANTPIDFRALNTILVSATYYMVLHAKTNGSTICDVDVNTEEGKERVLKTMQQILDWSYGVAEKNPS